MIYTVTLNPALDYTTGRAGERMDPGGKGLNVAKTLQAFGIPAVAAGIAAGKNGYKLCQLAESVGLQLAMVSAPGETRMNQKIFDGTGVIEHNQPGPVFDPSAFAQLCSVLCQQMKPGDTLALCGSLPPAAPADCYARLAALVPSCRVVVDTSGAALAASLAAKPDAVKPNLAELAQLAGRPLPDAASRMHAARELLARGAQRVLLSLGGEGAMLATPAGVWSAAAPAVPVRGTVGAGDAMTAVLCHAPLEDAPALLRACVAAGCAAVMQPGSLPPQQSDWASLLPRIQVTRCG